MITLYGFPRSRSLRVSWTLEELNLPWQFQLVDVYKGEHKQADFLAMNAAGKVPALKDDELVITESSAICLYLAEKAGQLLPQPATAASAKHHQWISFIGNELEQPLWTSAKHKFALPESLRQEAILPVAQWEFEKAVAVAEQWTPKEGFLLGEQFTVADILLAHTLNWALKFEQKLPEKLAAYRKRVSARPALARALEKEQGL